MIFLVPFLAAFAAFTGSAGSASDEDEYFEFWRWTSRDVSLYPTLPIAVTSSEDKRCREDSLSVVAHLRNQTYWAVQMWDSSATSPFGTLYGNKYILGNYDECLLVKEPIKAQFCNVKVKATVHLGEASAGDPYDLDPSPNAVVWKKFQDSRRDHSKYPRDEAHWGLCVPSSCNRSELEKGINLYLTHLNKERLKSNGTTYEVEIPEDYCQNGVEEELSLGEMGFWAFTTALIAAVVVVTFVDASQSRKSEEESRTRRLFMCFSLRRNVRQLTGEQHSEGSSHLKFLHGVKVVTIIFIVFDHHVMFFLISAVVNKQDLEGALRSWQNMFVPNGDLLVDTCFFIGGVLVTHFILEYSDKARLNPFLVVLMRLFRLAPLYFYIVWFQASAWTRFGSGPAWKFGLKNEIEYCRKNWWANILFVQNYINSYEMCMLHAWYLPCDFHFFIVSVLVTMTIKKNKALGVGLLYFITFLSVIVPGVITYVYELNPTMEFQPRFLDKPRSDLSFQLLYVKSHTRITVYLLGMITAYHLHNSRNTTWKISRVSSVLGCLVGLGLLFAPMAYGGNIYYNPRREYNVIEASIFASVRRLFWGLAWVLFLIINRFGIIPIFGRVFSWRIAVPLSKTTYAVYLIHFIFQMSDHAKIKIPHQFNPFDMFVKGTNDLVFSVCSAFVFYLFLELPFKLFFKELLFPKPSKKQASVQPEKYLQNISTIQQEVVPKTNGIRL